MDMDMPVGTARRACAYAAYVQSPFVRLADAVKGYVATDQPGRWCAVCLFSPWLMRRAVVHQDAGIAAFAALLFSWDLYWLACKAPRRVGEKGDEGRSPQQTESTPSFISTTL